MPDYAKITDQETAPLLGTLHKRFADSNGRLSSLLNRLDDKLNNIHNKRTPEKEVAREKDMANDAIQALNSEAAKYDNSNDRFEKLLNHLSEII